MPWELYGNIKYSIICLELAIIENSSHIIGGVFKGDFEGFWCPNDTLLAKTMDCGVDQAAEGPG